MLNASTGQGPNRNPPIQGCQDPFCMITTVESAPVVFTRAAKLGAAIRPVFFYRAQFGLARFELAQVGCWSHAWEIFLEGLR